MARKPPELSEKERANITRLIKRNQEVHQKIFKLTGHQYHQGVPDSVTHYLNESRHLRELRGLISQAKRLKVVLPTSARQRLRKLEREYEAGKKQLLGLAKEANSLEQEKEIVFATKRGICPLCGKTAPCSRTF